MNRKMMVLKKTLMIVVIRVDSGGTGADEYNE
jgi:hypothetical protein